MTENVEEFLAHYGVKGMKWGVRKKEERSTRDRAKSENKKLSKKIRKNSDDVASKKATKKEEEKNLAQAKQKFADKYTDQDSHNSAETKRGWRPSKTQIAIAGIGAAYIALTIYGLKKNPIPITGDISNFEFMEQVRQSQKRVWRSGNHISPEVRAIGEFSLPVGHTFHKLSGRAISELRSDTGTYMTSNIDDVYRYVSGFRKELDVTRPFHSTFRATKEIKVPSVDKTIEVMQRVLEKQHPGFKIDPVRTLESFSGGKWNTFLEKTFLKELRDEGYGAILDTMDAGVIGDTPLFVFATDLLEGSGSKKMSNDDVRTALTSIKELSNRR